MDLGADKPKKALAILTRLISAYPDAMKVRFERAMVLLNLDRGAEAIADLERVLDVDPSFPGAKDWLARVHGDQGKFMLAAEMLLSDLLETAPDHWSANGQKWADCAHHFLRAGDAERALSALAVYFEHYEGRQRGYEAYLPAPHRIRAKALLAAGRPQEALEAIESFNGPAGVLAFVRVQILVALGRAEEAKAAFEPLRMAYAGTDPLKETLAYARQAGVNLE